MFQHHVRLGLMTSSDDWKEIKDLIRDATQKNRGYAGFFDWPDRDQKELGIAIQLFESLEAREGLEYRQVWARGAGNDPPDCEARDSHGALVGLEVTELVDADAIKSFKAGDRTNWAEWDEAKFVARLKERVSAKDSPREVKGGPYAEYWLLIHCDEPALSIGEVRKYMATFRPCPTRLLTAAFLLLSYHPGEGYPYFRLPLTHEAHE